MGNQENKEEAGQGFDGLSSMVSDVESTVENARMSSQSSPKPSTQPAPPTSGRSSSGGAIYQSPTQPSSGAPVIKWILIIGGVVLLGSLIMSGSGNKNTTANASPKGNLNSSSNYSQPERFREQMPSVGTNSVLNSAEIHYCLAEKIRMEGAEGAVNNYDENSVDRFNRMVNNYNSRCGQFRYRSGALESARRDVEAYRNTLLSEGRSRM